MCEIKNLNENERRVNIELNDGTIINSGWYIDNGDIVDGRVNCTKDEILRYNGLLKKNGVSESDVKTWYISRKRKDGEVYISDHAFQRMKERCGLSKKAAIRHVAKVVEKGQDLSEVKGYLAPWAKQREERSKEGERQVMYGNFVYLFTYDTLTTVIYVPQKGKVTNVYNKAVC